MKKELRKDATPALQCFRGGGSLKASLLKGLRHMLSLREGQSPTKQSGLYVIANAVKQSPCLYGLPRILTNARNDKMAGICERDGLISHNALSPYRPSALTPLAKAAFTMAEILLSLTIIGVVAAITLPSLTGNINERTWNTQRKALYARISQAVALLPNVNLYGSPDNWEDTATESFLTAGLSKVLKINNICDNEHLADCGFPSKIIPYSGSKITSIPRTMYEWHDGVSCSATSVNIPNTKAAAFETANGESVLAYYNPRCLNLMNYANTWSNAFYKRICVNLIYDLNGKRGPNVMGKDIGFITIMNPTDPIVVAPRIYNGVVQAKGIELANQKCREKFGEVSRIPNDYEMTALTINGKLIGYQNLNYPFWISDMLRTLDDGRKSYYVQYMNDGSGAPGRRWEQLGTAGGTCLCIIKD